MQKIRARSKRRSRPQEPLSDDPGGAAHAEQGGLDARSWTAPLLAILTLVALMAGAAKTTWSLGLCVLLAGLGVLLASPRFKLPRLPACLLLALALVPLVGLLPAAWLGGLPVWRKDLWTSWGIGLPDTVSPLPWATLESWAAVVAGVVWLWACLSLGASSTGRRWSIYLLSIGGSLIAVASWYDLNMEAIRFWPRDVVNPSGGFGPFLNRNHTSSLNAISALLCLASAYDAYQRKSKLTWLFLLLLWPPLTAIFVNTSRAGLVLLAVGAVSWVAIVAMRKNTAKKALVGLSLVMVVAAVALVSSGQLGGRLRDMIHQGQPNVLSSSMRVELAAETLAQVVRQPWIGQGFDTFQWVFPVNSGIRVPEVRFIHPESDVLTLLFEGGLLALLPALALLVWLIRSSGPWRNSRSEKIPRERLGRRIRQAAGLGAALALLHGLVDVPNHGFAYWMHTALLAGLAIQPKKLGALRSGLGRLLPALTALLVMGAGTVWLGSGLEWWRPDLPSSVPALRSEAANESRTGRYREALALVDRAIWLSPLDFRLYYQRAQLLLALRQRPERALADFGRSRAVEPHYAGACLEEGILWLRHSPDLALIAWRECLFRQSEGSASEARAYHAIVMHGIPFEELHMAIWGLARNVDMQLDFMAFLTTPAQWQKYLDLLMEAHPGLEGLESGQLRTLFTLWPQRGGLETMLAFVEKFPRFTGYAWRQQARKLAQAGDYEEALTLAAKYLKPLDHPPARKSADLGRLERNFVLNATDVRTGVELFFAQRAASDLNAAQVTGEKLLRLPDVPAYMWRELADLHREKGELRRAWERMEEAMLRIPDA